MADLCQVSLKLGSGECQTSTVVLFACPAIPGLASLVKTPGAGHCSVQCGHTGRILAGSGSEAATPSSERRARAEALTGTGGYSAWKALFGCMVSRREMSLSEAMSGWFFKQIIIHISNNAHLVPGRIFTYGRERREICLSLGFADPPISYLTLKWETRGMFDDEIMHIRIRGWPLTTDQH